MQRQHGLSSPVTKQQQDDGSGSDAFLQMAVPEESSASSSKADKARLVREERTIHLIPLLTFLCFLLLFLCSHDPSDADMSSFGGGVGGKSGNRRLRML
ncbi:hypothetical protein QOZ80_2AG0141790 [Eleusine coracana subsp. coracana]|nr:hypothetical protein QOZ80_2AG0141790 [Eleusine coracana subsp. coracana]